MANYEGALERLENLGLKQEAHFTNDGLNKNAYESTGCYARIGFVEERCPDLVRTKRGSDGAYYKMTYLRISISINSSSQTLQAIASTSSGPPLTISFSI